LLIDDLRLPIERPAAEQHAAPYSEPAPAIVSQQSSIENGWARLRVDLRRPERPATVASFRTWRDSRASVAQSPKSDIAAPGRIPIACSPRAQTEMLACRVLERRIFSASEFPLAKRSERSLKIFQEGPMPLPQELIRKPL
jgi:hypothetical protein